MLNSRINALGTEAIAPLPLRDPLPPPLRALEWTHESGEQADVIRELFGLEGLEAEKENDLGCAYALLAFDQKSDEFWIQALRHLSSAKTKDFEKAERNLERVSKVSEIPAGGSSFAND